MSGNHNHIDGWKEAAECPGNCSELVKGQTKAYAFHRGVWLEFDLPPLPESSHEGDAAGNA